VREGREFNEEHAARVEQENRERQDNAATTGRSHHQQP
jgi:hypothetical protein